MSLNRRRFALEWWNNLNLESQFYNLIEFNDFIEGDRTRHPSTLTGGEIEIIYCKVKKLDFSL